MSYTDVLKLHLKERHIPADKHWQTLLYIATSNDKFWSILWPIIDLHEGTVDFEQINSKMLSSSQQILIEVAQDFFNHSGSISLSKASDTLDHDHWKILFDAILIYRRGD